MRNLLAFLFPFLCIGSVHAQSDSGHIVHIAFDGEVTLTLDIPSATKANRKSVPILILYALPNGNTTAQTMGKKTGPSDDWHFDIQHIGAQTEFIRKEMPERLIYVAYLENSYRSWPQWKLMHTDYREKVQAMVDTLRYRIPESGTELYLNGHSGGGRFIFSYLDGVNEIPAYVKRISFLDSDYGYDSSYLPKLKSWLATQPGACLNIFAYNDSVALYNGKPVVSATGGTWYRSRRMLYDLSTDFHLAKARDDSLIVYKTPDLRIQFFLLTNPDRKIYHTRQVELNGFIHSVLCGTRRDQKDYSYYGERAYSNYIKP